MSSMALIGDAPAFGNISGVWAVLQLSDKKGLIDDAEKAEKKCCLTIGRSAEARFSFPGQGYLASGCSLAIFSAFRTVGVSEPTR